MTIHGELDKFGFSLGLIAFFFVCVVLPSVSNGSVNCEPTARGILQKIEVRDSEDERVQAALDLANYFRAHPGCGKSRSLIERVAVLLKDHTDGVRMGAAMALGNIGPRARSAIPALEEAVKESDAVVDADNSELNTVVPTSSSGAAARSALRQITGRPVPEYQEAWKKSGAPVSSH